MFCTKCNIISLMGSERYKIETTDLCDICLFRSLDPGQIDQLLSISNIKTFRDGNILFYEGERSEFLYFLLKGTIKEYKHNLEGDEAVVYFYTTPGMVGEEANFEHAEHHTTAECIGECIVMSITYGDFEAIFLKNPMIAMRLILQLSKKIKTAISHRLPLDATAKLARFICENEVLFHKIKRYQLAAMLNISPETLSRSLTKLRQKGLLLHNEGRYEIADKEALQKLYIESGCANNSDTIL